MPSSTQNYLSCTSCNFSPFCTNEEKNPLWTKQVNFTVKQHHHLKKKQTLYTPKDKFQNFYAIKRGALKTCQIDASGNELIRGFYYHGDVVGCDAIHDGYYSFSAVALTETIICEIPYKNFLHLLGPREVLQEKFLGLMSQQLNTGHYLALTSAEQRLAAFLINLHTRLNLSQHEIILPMSRQEIGNHLRLTAETVSRILSRLQNNKIIQISNKKLRLAHLDKLKKIADGLLLCP